MMNMGCQYSNIFSPKPSNINEFRNYKGNIDIDAKQTIKVQGKGSGLWFMRKKDTDSGSVKDDTAAEEVFGSGKKGESSGRKGTARPKKSTESIKNTDKKDDDSTKKSLPLRSSSFILFTKQPVVEEPEEEDEPTKETPRSRLSRSATVTSFWPGKMTKDDKDDLPLHPPSHQKSKSESGVLTKKWISKSSSPSRTQTEGSVEGKPL